jgi:hypothetical protein
MQETPRPEDTKSRTGDKWAPLLGFLTLILLFATLSSVFLRQRLAVWIFLVLGIASLIAFVILKRQAVFRFFSEPSSSLRYKCWRCHFAGNRDCRHCQCYRRAKVR